MTTSQSGSSESGPLDFLNTDLNRSIVAVTRQNKSLLCFVADETDISEEWEQIIRDGALRPRLIAAAVSVRIEKDSQEAAYLGGVVSITSTPAVVIIHNGQIKYNLQSAGQSSHDLKQMLETLFGKQEEAVQQNDTQTTDAESTTAYIVLPPSTGRMRLPNNAFDSIAAQTQSWIEQKITGDNILRLQLRLLENISGLAEELQAIRSRTYTTAPVLSTAAEDRLLNTPASALHLEQPAQVGSATPNTIPQQQPPNTQYTQSTSQPDSARAPGSASTTPQPASSSAGSAPQFQQVQRNQYLRQQREREAAQKAERERIKAQIKSDRDERRRLDEIRKQNELADLRKSNSTTAQPASTDIRLQVRAFDGSRMTTSFPRTATISQDVRSWVDQTSNQATPYNLKLILGPNENRNIEAGEEERALSDLGIVGSATMVMVPVKGFVESYTGGSGGIVSTVTGVAGSVIGGLGYYLGWGVGAPTRQEDGASGHAPGNSEDTASGGPSTVRVRTLADQRAEEASKRSNELYNGNQLNFQGRKDNDEEKKK